MQRLQFFKVFRPPLDLPNGPMIHWGIAVVDQDTGETVVLHNTPEKGEHVDHWHGFTAGLTSRFEPMPDTPAIRERFRAVVTNPKMYDLLSNNCQHTVTRVAQGISWSPGLCVLALFVVVGVVIYAANQRSAPAMA
ncbi:MAG TPA: hypothetical protein VGO35_07355 [Gammaproteobacteria bacterium]|jgi:hypothetical protein|nr:hypothetical protein [Gammaproteobacteria bacterium]